MNREDFEDLVFRSFESLPDEFKDRLENVSIVIEDYPNSSQLRRVHAQNNETLLGLYEGVPLTERGQNYGMVLPDKITIFQRPIEARCRNQGLDLSDEIVRVVEHEIAHYFGISDERLDEIDNSRR